MSNKKIVSIVGALLMAVSLAFVALRLQAYAMDFAAFASPFVVAGLLVTAVINGVGIIAAAFNYRALVVAVSGVVVAPVPAVMAYSGSNMYKYIPGGVMFVLGRNRLAVDNDELSHVKVALATLLEGVFVVLAAVLAALLFAAGPAIAHLRQFPALSIALAALALTIPVIYAFRNPIKTLFKRLSDGDGLVCAENRETPSAVAATGKTILNRNTKILRPPFLAKRLSFAFALISIWGATFWAALALLGQPMTLGLTLTIIGLYILAWLAGFIIPGVPGGIGIREAALLIIMGGIVDEGILLSATIAHRTLTVVGDTFAHCIALFYSRCAKRRNN